VAPVRRRCHNVTREAGLRPRGTLATLSGVNVTRGGSQKSSATLATLTVVNVTREVL